eukprot:4827134-Prymnesium_polylepis.1
MSADGHHMGAFWSAVQFQCKPDPKRPGTFFAGGYKVEEYSNLLGFAYNSPKWRDRYEWQIVGHAGLDTWPALSTAAHWRSKHCLMPQLTVRDRDPDAFARGSSRTLFYPSMASSGTAWVYEAGANTEWLALRKSPRWERYVRARQRALVEYAQINSQISIAEICDANITGSGVANITSRWNACFEKQQVPDPSNWKELIAPWMWEAFNETANATVPASTHEAKRPHARGGLFRSLWPERG